MNTNIRSILSTSTALGLASFAIISAFVVGVAAAATLLSFGLLAVYGLLEIAIVSYQAPRLFSAPTRQPAPAGTVAEFPVAERRDLARAA